MQHIDFSGNITTSSREVAESVVGRWLNVDVTMKEEFGAFETVYEDDSLYVYCHEENPRSIGLYLLEGNIDGPLSMSVDRLRSLARICREGGLMYQIDYSETDDDGNVIGDERTIQLT